MTQEDILQLDETALCLFRRLHILYEDAHAWFQDTYRAQIIHGSDKFLRLQDISNERDQVSMDLSEHIAYVLLSKSGGVIGTPGIRLDEAVLIQDSVNRMNLQRVFEEAQNELHDHLRALKVIP